MVESDAEVGQSFLCQPASSSLALNKVPLCSSCSWPRVIFLFYIPALSISELEWGLKTIITAVTSLRTGATQAPPSGEGLQLGLWPSQLLTLVWSSQCKMWLW